MEQIILIIFYLVTLFFSIILHEIAHGVMAMWLGDHTARLAGRLTLDPIKHIDPFGSIILPILMFYMSGGAFAFGWAKPVPYNPYELRGGKWGEVLVAFAGPFTNFSIALIASILGMLTPLSIAIKWDIISQLSNWSELSILVAGAPMSILFSICVMLIFWNVILAVFNLIPVPPLDGSKLLFYFVDIDSKTRITLERWGIFFIVFILSIPIFSNFFSRVLGFFWTLFFTMATMF